MRVKKFSIFGAVIVGILAGDLGSVSAADLNGHQRHRSPVGRDVYADDYGCQVQEPAEYRPRIANYNQPLCYAGRPYGISTHLYDHPRELGGYNSAVGY